MRLLSAEAIAAQHALRRLLDDVVSVALCVGVELPLIFRELDAAGERAALRFSVPLPPLGDSRRVSTHSN